MIGYSYSEIMSIGILFVVFIILFITILYFGYVNLLITNLPKLARAPPKLDELSSFSADFSFFGFSATGAINSENAAAEVSGEGWLDACTFVPGDA